MTFRLAKDADMRTLHALFYAHLILPRFRDYFCRIVERQDTQQSFWLVGASGAELVGNCQLISYPHGAELANLGVRSEWRKRGIGTAMIYVLIGIARHIGLESLEVGVESSNHRAKKLYQRLGFAEDRRLRPVGRASSAIILRKEL